MEKLIFIVAAATAVVVGPQLLAGTMAPNVQDAPVASEITPLEGMNDVKG